VIFHGKEKGRENVLFIERGGGGGVEPWEIKVIGLGDSTRLEDRG